ncbi:MAG: LPS export ABC transporter periplasmic protein LptC [Ignavibacteriales bacterium]|nr:LPS export ABC transporter periplasmic protein LptC [Ignavibacteriales bacterium]
MINNLFGFLDIRSRVVLLLSITLLLLVLSGCQSAKVKPIVGSTISSKDMPAQESWQSVIVFTDSGKTKAVLHTGYLRAYPQRMETLLDSSVQVDFYNLLQKIETVLTSKHGKVDDRTKNLFAYENVVVKNTDGVTLESEELLWENERAKIITDKFVTITTKVEKIQGYGFESDQFLRNYVIHKVTYVTAAKGSNE